MLSIHLLFQKILPLSILALWETVRKGMGCVGQGLLACCEGSSAYSEWDRNLLVLSSRGVMQSDYYFKRIASATVWRTKRTELEQKQGAPSGDYCTNLGGKRSWLAREAAWRWWEVVGARIYVEGREQDLLTDWAGGVSKGKAWKVTPRFCPQGLD